MYGDDLKFFDPFAEIAKTGHRLPHWQQLGATYFVTFRLERWWHHGWVVMPNHVHCLTSLGPGWTLESVLHSWKSYSGTLINRLVERRGPVWQANYFDRIIRDEDHFGHVVRYIRLNPIKAGLRPGTFSVYESEFVRGL